MKSKTLIETQMKKKTNTDLVKTILACKKNPAWIEVAAILASPARNKINANLDRVNKVDGEMIVVAGKILSVGNLDKKIKVVALAASEAAIEKINKSGSTFSYIIDEVNKNAEAKGMVLLK